MKKAILFLLILALLTGCQAPAAPTLTPTTAVPTTTVAPAQPPTTAPLHSALYLQGMEPEQVLRDFNEIVHQMEYSDGTGDPTLAKKWLSPIRYSIHGAPTDEDLRVLEDFFSQLNEMEGFPGIYPAKEGEAADLTLSFLDHQEFWDSFSDAVDGEDALGATQFWYYTDTGEIHTARIGYRTDLDQTERSSILLEEVVNTLGLSDSLNRTDSIVYQYSNDNLSLSEVDWLILKLLYHPAIESGMTEAETNAVISELYY